jgi:MFS transporter, ACS family, hexuronate transporter
MVDMTTEPTATALGVEPRATARAWAICALMLCATMLNYMDRQALAQQATEICRDLNLSNEEYARIESRFGLAFAIGGIIWGFLADRVSPRWLYPCVLIGWSAVGYATGSATSFKELYGWRILLGFFESGQWPCALVTSQRLLSRRDRPLGNGILQSGASLGAIVTPVVVLALATQAPFGWRLPFRLIGASGAIWVVAWLATVRSRDLHQPEAAESENRAGANADFAHRWFLFLRRFVALVVVVTLINLCWQFFRVWMPKMLREQYGYTAGQVQAFSVAYFIAADVGCLSIGFLVKWLSERNWPVHRARMATFFVCTLLTATSVVAAFAPPASVLLAALLVIGFGSLGQFPNYYAFTQELSARRMGNVTGILSFLFWISYAMVSEPIGAWIDKTHSFSQVMVLAGLLPIVSFLVLVLAWGEQTERAGET